MNYEEMSDEELDAAVAKRVMGWTNDGTFWRDPQSPSRYERSRPSDCVDCGTDFPAWSPSTEIADAWLVVEKMRELGFDYSVNADPSGLHFAMFRKERAHDEDLSSHEHDESAPRAICLAALRAVEGE